MKQTLIDPIPCFIPMWTNAINFAQLKSNKESLLTQSVTTLIENKFDMNYSDCPSCLVGEAHQQLGKGTNIQYTITGEKGYCSKCAKMCGDKALVAVKKGGNSLIQFKVSLYNHMVIEHGFKGKKINPKKLNKVSKC